MPSPRLSKLISYFLRHAPGEAGLTLDEWGWTPVAPLLSALSKKGHPLSAADLRNLTTAFGKVRWEFSADGGRIRATHGHSVDVAFDEETRAVPPPVLYHGTTAAAAATILKEGLKPMGRQAVHLAATAAEARIVGQRHGAPVVVVVDAGSLAEAGGAFYRTAEGVWLTGPVAVEYLTLMEV